MAKEKMTIENIKETVDTALTKTFTPTVGGSQVRTLTEEAAYYDEIRKTLNSGVTLFKKKVAEIEAKRDETLIEELGSLENATEGLQHQDFIIKCTDKTKIQVVSGGINEQVLAYLLEWHKLNPEKNKISLPADFEDWLATNHRNDEGVQMEITHNVSTKITFVDKKDF